MVLPELGAYYFGGAGFTPYIYFYNNNLSLINKVDISSFNITIIYLVGLSDGGFVGIGNTDGGDNDTHLFYFNSSGNLIDQRDITIDIPSLATKDFMNFTISSTNDGGVIVTELFESKVWIYHSHPLEVDLSTKGVSSIHGIGGSYFQADNDLDGVPVDEDNCPNHYNPNQEDTYPPGGNGIGDVCECEGDFTCDGDVDAEDVTAFLGDFGRGQYSQPCTNGDPCNGDFSCDGDVDATDVTRFLEDFGRGQYSNPCPACEVRGWCEY